ncbi:MAG: aminotransferase class I/II-fold pyridoxal phosphate-dependent enzyme [Pseudomonadota bacterium]
MTTYTKSRAALQAEFDRILNENLSLDLTRGKPGADQLELSDDLFEFRKSDLANLSALDIRNYGGMEGLPAMRALFGEILGLPAEQTLIGGNSSLSLMHDYLMRACQFGVDDNHRPWHERPERKFLCPTPGYDRHFLITQQLGFELIPIDMTDAGPNMDQVEGQVAGDPNILGIWCVPKFSNPTGVCYSEATIQRLASMKCQATDFRIMWDNAYAEHGFSGKRIEIANILEHCESYGNGNRVIEFASTSKMTFPGAGVAAIGASVENIERSRSQISVQSIGPDKINQARQLAKFPTIAALRDHMEKQGAIVAPKFAKVDSVLQREFGNSGAVEWTRPQGGYFISLDVNDGLAGRVVDLARQAGVALTKAGAPFPYGRDPRDRNIRIAPTFATVEEVDRATGVLCTCIQLAMALD